MAKWVPTTTQIKSCRPYQIMVLHLVTRKDSGKAAKFLIQPLFFWYWFSQSEFEVSVVEGGANTLQISHSIAAEQFNHLVAMVKCATVTLSTL